MKKEHPPPTKPSDAEIRELQQLVEQATHTGEETIDSAAQRVRVCAMIGARLLSFKSRLGHGNWQSWQQSVVKEIGRDVTIRTFQKWMKLSKQVKDGTIKLEDARGLRHAYVLAGILPDADDSRSKASISEPLLFTHALRLASSLGQLTMENLDAEFRRVLKERLKPIALVFQQL